ncbi:ComF family protein [Brevibacillus sp. SYP-B805]|uniref:ComF family protein n=1 Tax=Brevibacillus sp. SYP-B805 TaxID=1578199 RepID=UPI0013EC3AEC|nr:ComF family protein [Brevibacillus sp. SYP-B805]NGQ95625.1 ComF family protein [Brevibacillus sp. SYP-B805]
MRDKCCLSCGRSWQSKSLLPIQQQLARALADENTYPALFRLLARMRLCADCLVRLPLLGPLVCPGCGRGMPSGETCADCRRYADEHLKQNRSLLSYNDWGRSMIRQFKYRGDERLGDLFADLLAVGYYRHYRGIRFQLVTHVPLHEARMRDRGFDQAERIAVRFSEITGIPFFPLLTRIKNTDKLSKQGGRLARWKSMQAAFSPRERMPVPYGKRPEHILLIDDIYTTGSTVRACAAAIHGMPEFAQTAISSLSIFR